MDLNDIVRLRESWKNDKKTVVFTNGCFDLLHVGHLSYLEQAKSLGDYLIVAINSDASVRHLKGDSRPIHSERDRLRLIQAMSVVDVAFIFHEETPLSVISKIKPDIHTKGGDYEKESLVEYDAVIQHGGQVIILPFIDGKSTTTIIQKIKSQEG